MRPDYSGLVYEEKDLIQFYVEQGASDATILA